MGLVYPGSLPLPDVSGNSQILSDTFYNTEAAYAITQRARFGEAVTVPLSFLCESREQARDFTAFYYSITVYGMLPFEVTWPIYGDLKPKQVKFAEVVKTTALGEGVYRISCVFEVLTSIEDMLADEDIIAPEYDFTQALYLDTGYYYVPNISGSVSIYDGKLLNSDASAYTPTSTQYPLDGTIDLTSAKYIDTQWTAPSDEEWYVMGVYNVDIASSTFDVFAQQYNGDGTVDVWLGDQDSTLTLLPENTGLAWIPPLSTYKIIETPALPFN